MIVRGRDFTDIWDLVGIRILVDSVRDCYAALGIMHAHWQPVPGRFKDFVAMPKFNMYQSLHTTVIGPQGKPVELQIRTHDMHRTAEYGIAAHWKYKEKARAGGKPSAGEFGAPPKAGSPDDMLWLRQLLDWQREAQEPGEFLETLRYDLGPQEVFVFTPKGDVISLPGDVDAGRLRLRGAHRGRPPHASAPGSTARWSRWTASCPTATSSRSSPPGRRRPARRRTGWRSSAPPARAPRSGSGSPRSAARTPSRPARRRSPAPCARPGCRCSGCWAARRCRTLAKDLHYADVTALYAAVGENQRLGVVGGREADHRAGRHRGRGRGHRRDGDPDPPPGRRGARPAATPASSSTA